MTNEMKRQIESLTDSIIRKRRLSRDSEQEIIDTEKTERFKKLITEEIISVIKDASIILGRAGCSLNYYSNELAVIRDPKKRIFIQILFYPYGHSKITLGVNAPFLQFSYSPLKENIKITTKVSIKSDVASTKIAEIEIDDFALAKIDMYIINFLKNVVKQNI